MHNTVIQRGYYWHSKCVFSVGGFNVNSYSLLLDITKGRYFTATDGRVITVNHMNFSGFKRPQNQISCLLNILRRTKLAQNLPASRTYGFQRSPRVS